MSVYGIPTEYNGRNYRSRLEARWAAMFDFLGWKYEYEPIDLPGWIPDFIIHGASDLVVEIKPFTSLGPFDTSKIESALIGSPYEWSEALLFGAVLPWEGVIGWIGEIHGDRESLTKGEEKRVGLRWWQEARHCFHGDVGGIWASEGHFHCRITGEYDGGGGPGRSDEKRIERLWAEAANITQWQPKAKVARPTRRGVQAEEW